MSALDPPAWMRRKFPELRSHNFEVTSDEDGDYNCIAWAMHNDNRTWWPAPEHLTGGRLGGYFWPFGAPVEESLFAFMRAFGNFGYVPCESDELEPEWEKIAIFVGPGSAPTHAARQLDNGKWASKLGPKQDIEHDSLTILTGSEYGRVGAVMRRPRLMSGPMAIGDVLELLAASAD